MRGGIRYTNKLSPPFLYTCKADLFIAKQAEDAVVELHVSAVALVHFSQYSHQLCTSLGGMGALALMCRQLVERTLPRAANSLVLTLCHPGNIIARKERHGLKKMRSFTEVAGDEYMSLSCSEWKVLIISKGTNYQGVDLINTVLMINMC